MSFLLTIGITSYNRVNELKRCLQSIDTNHPKLIEVLVSEDRSPLRYEIEEMVEEFASTVPFLVRFYSNEHNLGYDRNLKNIIEMADGEYIFFISDDDMLYPNTIDKVLYLLRKYAPAILYGSCYLEEVKEKRRCYGKSRRIQRGEKQAAYYLYDSILFSGLVFKRKAVIKLDAEPFLNKNYFQVYMFLYCIVNYGGVYLNHLSVHAVGDGENAYGHSESSESNPLLADRTSIFSNLEFHKGLIYVIRKFDADFGTKIFRGFQCQYNIHSYTGLASAEKLGKKTLREYWKKMNLLDIRINFISRLYYGFLIVFGNRMASKILSIPKNILLGIRDELH